MDLINISLIIVYLVNLALAWLIYSRGKGDLRNTSFTLVIVAIISWIWGMFMYRNVVFQGDLIFWTKILYAGATLIPSTFLYFSVIFPYRKKHLSYSRIFLIALSNVAAIIITFWPNLVIKDAILHGGKENEIIFGEGYYFYALYITIMFGLALGMLFHKYLKAKGVVRLQLKFTFLAYILPILLACVTNLIMPWLGDFRLNWLGQDLTIIMVVFTTYAILKFRLFDVKLIAAQIFIVLLLLALLINIMPYRSVEMLTFGIFILVGAIIFGVLLIKSFMKTQQLTEQLQEAKSDLEKKVGERTQELQQRTGELEKFYRLTVGRELKMVELKKQIKDLEGAK